MAVEAAEEVGPGGVEEVVPAEVEGVHRRQRGGRTVHLGQRHRPVEGDDGRRRERLQLVVQLQDLLPVGVDGGRGVAVDGADGGLELIGAGLVAADAAGDQCLPLGDQRPVPPPSVLVG